MKNITDYQAAKYKAKPYRMVESGIYEANDRFLTSLSFVQEPDYGEGCDSALISQYPMEDILDAFMVYISDFYDPENSVSNAECHLEFASEDITDIRRLRTLIGKTVRTVDGRLTIQ